MASCEKLRRAADRRYNPEISEWRNPAGGKSGDSRLNQIGFEGETQGSETSQYLKEKKSTEIPQVVANERGLG